MQKLPWTPLTYAPLAVVRAGYPTSLIAVVRVFGQWLLRFWLSFEWNKVMRFKVITEQFYKPLKTTPTVKVHQPFLVERQKKIRKSLPPWKDAKKLAVFFLQEKYLQVYTGKYNKQLNLNFRIRRASGNK